MLTSNIDTYSECIPLPIIFAGIVGFFSGAVIGEAAIIYCVGQGMADIGAGIGASTGLVSGTGIGILIHGTN